MPFKPVVFDDKGESVVVGVVVAEVGVGEVRVVESSGEHLIAASKEGEASAAVDGESDVDVAGGNVGGAEYAAKDHLTVRAQARLKENVPANAEGCDSWQ